MRSKRFFWATAGLALAASLSAGCEAWVADAARQSMASFLISLFTTAINTALTT
jgi:hypothetical protein